ncbi:hypothetical protein CQJ27_23465 [Escherichia sp. E1130]|nr:hypothetical protein CQB02_22775 [Escherichia coli]TGB99993.1 hypothetical protein CRG92_15120 [Escherichia sp. E2586]TGC14023.1 hypothetical protein CQJ28_20365 [Escherichia sp. E2562]TGC22067.1 hypothetical protein CQJ27_23465 [Escherichia sp. E1130]
MSVVCFYRSHHAVRNALTRSVRSARPYIPLLFLFILIDSVSFFKPQRPYRYSQVIINKRIKK